MKNRIIVLDTETCNILPLDKVTPGNNLPYDIGYSIIEPATDSTVLTRDFVVNEIFYGEQERMQSAYYADKLPQYFEEIESGIRTPENFLAIMMTIAEDCKRENVVAICMHNARFDVDALNTCFEFLYGFKCRVLPNLEIWDSMKMAKTFTSSSRYHKYCESHGYMTKHKTPRPRMTAEIIYRYISKDEDFVERHTALADTEIEKEIVFKAFRTHRKMERILYPKY